MDLATPHGPADPAGWIEELVTRGTLTVCSYAYFEPMIHGDGQGIEADLLREVARRLEVAIRFVPVETFDGIWLRVLDDPASCDLAAGGLSATEARIADGVAFTAPHYRNLQSLLIRKADQGRIQDYPDLDENDIVGVVPGTTGERYAVARATEAGKRPDRLIRGYPSEDELVPALQRGEIAAVARGVPGNEHQAALDPALAVTARRDFGERFAFAIHPRNRRLRERIDATLALIQNARGVDAD